MPKAAVAAVVLAVMDNTAVNLTVVLVAAVVALMLFGQTEQYQTAQVARVEPVD